MPKSNRIHDLYFGVMAPAWNHTEALLPANLFDLGRIRYWAAKWLVLQADKSPSVPDNPLVFIFGDVMSRVEYEWIVAPISENLSDTKIDVFEAYVRPNEKMLLEMVAACSVNSARNYLREQKLGTTR